MPLTTHDTSISNTVALSICVFMSCTSGWVPIITMASAPAACELVRPNIMLRSADVPPDRRCMTHAASHLLSIAATMITVLSHSVAVSPKITDTSIIMPTLTRK